jgi:DNA primase
MAMPPFRIDHGYGSDDIYQLSIETYMPDWVKGFTQCVVGHKSTKNIGAIGLVKGVYLLNHQSLGIHLHS